jgi:hypothetical protein
VTEAWVKPDASWQEQGEERQRGKRSYIKIRQILRERGAREGEGGQPQRAFTQPSISKEKIKAMAAMIHQGGNPYALAGGPGFPSRF